MSNNEHTLAANAYRNTAGEQMNGFEVVVELYKGIIKNIEDARESYKTGRLDEMATLNAKTNKILIGLQANLDFEQGGEAAEFLNQFYNGIFAKLSKILRTDNPEAEFNTLLEHIKPVYEIWCTHAKNSKTSHTGTSETTFTPADDHA